MTRGRNTASGPDGRVNEHYTDDLDPALVERKVGNDAGPIRFENVSKRYGNVIALDGVTFEAGAGEFHCLAGPNGSGKTTLGELAVGLTRPTTGAVRAPDAVDFGFQDPRFYSDLTVRENVAVFCRLAGESPASDWVRSILTSLRMTRVEQQVAADLSGGFKKKLDVSIALLDAPAYLWLDEPLTDVDDTSVERLISLLETYVAVGGGVVVSTHNVEDFADSMTHMTAFLDGRKSETVDLSESSRGPTGLYEDLIGDPAGPE